MEFHEALQLSNEQEFQVVASKHHMKRMSREQLEDMLSTLVVQLLIKDNVVRQLMKEVHYS